MFLDIFFSNEARLQGIVLRCFGLLIDKVHNVEGVWVFLLEIVEAVTEKNIILCQVAIQ